MDTSYKTRNLAEAAYLFALGYSPKLYQESNDTTYWFVFPVECEQISKSYWDKSGKVGGKEYADCLRNLKERIFAKQ
jgi:hypothetical protein